MTYTVAEAERILAEAKAREAAVDPLLIEAREVCARFYEADGSPSTAADHRAGKYDDGDSQQTIAPAALRRGMELSAQPSPAPSEEDDLLLARECAADASLWGSPQDVALAAIRAERERAGGVKAEPEWIDWHGGKCPVPAGTWVEVKIRDGGDDTDDGAFYDWDHTPHKRDWEIVRYRILGEQP